jgi:hypothetical protein
MQLGEEMNKGKQLGRKGCNEFHHKTQKRQVFLLGVFVSLCLCGKITTPSATYLGNRQDKPAVKK